ncbi:MAG: prohibitin family protein [Deltaproteobacteria bacterium]
MDITNQNRPKFQLPSSVIKIIITSFVLLIVLLIISGNSFITLNPGEKGVLFRKFSGGLEKGKIYSEGFQMILPWNTMYIYDTRLKESFEALEVLSKNGLSIKVHLSYRFNPISEKIGILHESIGKGFHESIIKPEIRSSTREVIGKYLPEELYSTKREAIQDEIYQQTKKALLNKYINLDAVLIREVALPATLQAAIENKLKQEQESLEYEYKLEKERKEAERKIIEATAKAKANQILNSSLTENILKDKGIEATIKLAESQNAKTVIIGSTKDGLPLILGN